MRCHHVFSFAALLMLSMLAHAEPGACAFLEYAQVKDTATKKLVETYCYYGEIAKLQYDNSMQYPTDPAAVNWRANFSECADAQRKIETVLRARNVIPSCAATAFPGGDWLRSKK